jgi:hypothetical protein
MSTNTEQSIIEKVRAILDRANHPNTPQPEAETAFTLAQKLITKYNLDESALLDAQNIEEGIERAHIDIFGSYALRRLCVAGAVATANSCASYRSTVHAENWSEGRHGNYVRAKKGYRLYFYGTPKDIFATQVLWEAIETLGLRKVPTGDRAFKNSWWHGFQSGITKALNKATKEIIQDTGDTSVALVLRNRYKRADEEMRASVRLRSTRSSGASRSDAYRAGRSAGESFSTGGLNRGAIGAIGR